MIAARAAWPNVAFWAGLGLLLLIAAMVAWFLLLVREWVQSFTSWTREFGLLGAVAFATVYILAVVALAPVWPLSVAGGLAFGAWAIPLVIVSATTGASLAFLVARFIVRQRVTELTRKRPELDAVDKVVAEEGWKVVVLLRLSPLVPFNLQNYFLGATEIGFFPYFAATFLGIMPGSAAYVYLGILARAAAAGEQGGAGLRIGLLVAGLAATIALIVIIGRKARLKLQALGVDRRGR
jgi:uncharacterized membrane protein YdjX (TVP38/TMEM64 family)